MTNEHCDTNRCLGRACVTNSAQKYVDRVLVCRFASCTDVLHCCSTLDRNDRSSAFAVNVKTADPVTPLAVAVTVPVPATLPSTVKTVGRPAIHVGGRGRTPECRTAGGDEIDHDATHRRCRTRSATRTTSGSASPAPTMPTCELPLTTTIPDAVVVPVGLL